MQVKVVACSRWGGQLEQRGKAEISMFLVCEGHEVRLKENGQQ